MTFIITICAAVLLIAFSLYLAAEETTGSVLEELKAMEADYVPLKETAPAARPARKSETWRDSPSRSILSHEASCISPSLKRAINKYAEQLRRVKKWEHYAAHAKKARTRKKYRNRLREYYSKEPAFRPWGLDSGRGIDSTAGGWWLRSPGPGAVAFNTAPSKMGGFRV